MVCMAKKKETTKKAPAKRKKKPALNSKSRQAEILNTMVRPDGIGEDPLLQEVLGDKFEKLPDTEVLSTADALQTLIRGQGMSQEMYANMYQRMELAEERARQFEENQIQFMAAIRANAEALKVFGEAKDQLVAQAGIDIKQLVIKEKAKIASGRSLFDQQLRDMELVEVYSPGVMQMTHKKGVPQMNHYKEEVRIKHKRFVLEVGKNMVPKVVAERLASRRQQEQENREREQLLVKQQNTEELKENWAKLDQKHNSQTSGELWVPGQ